MMPEETRATGETQRSSAKGACGQPGRLSEKAEETTMPNFISTDVDSQRVIEAAYKNDEYMDEYQRIFNELANNIMPSLDPYWEGQAKSGFEQRFAAFTQKFRDLMVEYATLNYNLGITGEEYRDADSITKQIIAGLPK